MAFVHAVLQEPILESLRQGKSMPIIQRCPECRNFAAARVQVCSCGKRLPTGKGRRFYLKKDINRERHFRSLPSGTTLMEAESLYHEWITSLGVRSTKTEKAPLSIRTVADIYLNRLQVEGRSYFPNSKLFLGRLCAALGGDTPANDVTVPLARDIQTRLRNGGASPAYVDRHLAIYKAAWNYVIPEQQNPWNAVKFFRPDNNLVRWLSEKEIADLLLAATVTHHNSPPYFREIILIAIHTGMREENVLGLHTDQTDFDARLIRVTQKRGRQHTVPMNTIIYEALCRICPHDGGYYFPNLKTGEPYTAIRKTFATCKKLAGIDRPFRFHDLRHHAATTLLRKTKNLPLVGKILGHRSIVTTMRYAHVLDDDMREAVESLVLVDNNHDNNHAESATRNILPFRRN